jgi:DNA-binding beta-propeller fold protein YncE
MLPLSMNAGQWGEVIRVHVHSDGNIWVFHRCFNTVPPGHATCVGRGDLNPPILQFDHAGRLLTSFGAGLFAYPHGFTVDREGNLWASDVNDEATILGLSAKTPEGAIKGQEVLKLSPTGKVLMMLGKEGVSGNGPDAFDRPTGIAVAPNGDIFVSDGHYPNKHENARVMKFAKDGSFIKAWGQKGAAPGDFDEPHDIFLGGSQNRLYVADRRNNRIQVFDQDGNFLAAWSQFGTPSSVFVGKDDTIYVGTAYKDGTGKRGEVRGIVIGNAIDGTLKAFIPDPADLDTTNVGTSASGIAADDAGNIYAADVAAHNLRKYVKIK